MRNTEETSMGHLDSLKIVAKPITKPNTPEEQKRIKFISKLQEQLCLAEAELGGKRYVRNKWVLVPDYDGNPVREQVPIRIKKWWYKDMLGNILFSLRYGAKIINISGNNNAIEVGSIDKLPEIIKTIIKAVSDGELDGQFSNIQKERALNLKPKKSSAKNIR
jgi:hypothetical protein